MKEIEFQGKIYHKQKNGYYSRIERVQLHRVIWESHFGSIEKGFCIHHKDENKENNSIENLECIAKSEHAKLHWEKDDGSRKEKVRENLKKAHLWRSTREGKEYSSAHHKKLWENAKIYNRVCTVCGVNFESISRKKNIYCSGLCHSRGYYKKNREKRICKICKNEFDAYKYSNTETCSKKCTWTRANSSRRKTIEMKQKERIEKLSKQNK